MIAPCTYKEIEKYSIVIVRTQCENIILYSIIAWKNAKLTKHSVHLRYSLYYLQCMCVCASYPWPQISLDMNFHTHVIVTECVPITLVLICKYLIMFGLICFVDMITVIDFATMNCLAIAVAPILCG